MEPQNNITDKMVDALKIVATPGNRLMTYTLGGRYKLAVNRTYRHGVLIQTVDACERRKLLIRTGNVFSITDAGREVIKPPKQQPELLSA